MQARFILGPAGSGKTFRCLGEIRDALAADPDGPTLLLIAPKQTTYQLERQLLADPSVMGYTRLRILSFERLAFFIFEQLQKPIPRMLDEEGRIMVLRGLLTKKRDELKLFRASARLTGFAQHLSMALRELQRQQLTPESLQELAEKARAAEGLRLKLQDLSTLLGDYQAWLQAHGLQDSARLLDFATTTWRARHPPLTFGGLWVDGFTELSPQELDFLAEITTMAAGAAITFCLDQVPTERVSWLSNWAVVRQMYHQCHDRLASLPNCRINTELLPRNINESRFAHNPVLRYLEAHWAAPKPFIEPRKNQSLLNATLRVAACANPEMEAILAAREILRFVRSGGRYREVTLLARRLEGYHTPLVNIFTRYEIPFFLDRRESVSRHPLAQLTRNALRTVAYSWAHDDWFAALKTGLVSAADADIDQVENEALARGWQGTMWLKPLAIIDQPDLTEWVEDLRLKIVPPFKNLAMRMAQQNSQPNGTRLAAAMREFWQALKVDEILDKWSAEETDPRPIHLTVWEQMHTWLDNVELAFPTETLPLREWLPILEAGLAGVTRGGLSSPPDPAIIFSVQPSRETTISHPLVIYDELREISTPPQGD